MIASTITDPRRVHESYLQLDITEFSDPRGMTKRKAPCKTYTSLWVYSDVRVLRAYLEAQVQAISASRRVYYAGSWMEN